MTRDPNWLTDIFAGPLSLASGTPPLVIGVDLSSDHDIHVEALLHSDGRYQILTESPPCALFATGPATLQHSSPDIAAINGNRRARRATQRRTRRGNAA